jgi:hypothetical protein
VSIKQKEALEFLTILARNAAEAAVAAHSKARWSSGESAAAYSVSEAFRVLSEAACIEREATTAELVACVDLADAPKVGAAPCHS